MVRGWRIGRPVPGMRCVALGVMGAVRTHGSGHMGVAWLGETLLGPRDPRPTPVRGQGPSPRAPGQGPPGARRGPDGGRGEVTQGGSQLAGPGGVGEMPGADGLRGGQRRGRASGVPPPPGAAMLPRGGRVHGAHGGEEVCT